MCVKAKGQKPCFAGSFNKRFSKDAAKRLCRAGDCRKSPASRRFLGSSRSASVLDAQSLIVTFLSVSLRLGCTKSLSSRSASVLDAQSLIFPFLSVILRLGCTKFDCHFPLGQTASWMHKADFPSGVHVTLI